MRIIAGRSYRKRVGRRTYCRTARRVERESHERESGVAEIRTQLRRETAGIRTAITDLGTRIILWMVGTVLATTVLTFAVLQFLAK